MENQRNNPAGLETKPSGFKFELKAEHIKRYNELRAEMMDWCRFAPDNNFTVHEAFMAVRCSGLFYERYASKIGKFLDDIFLDAQLQAALDGLSIDEAMAVFKAGKV